MGNKGSRGMSYSQYYDFMKQQNGGTMQGVHLNLEGLDPYQVLGVRKQFTWDELKDAYRAKAKEVHPDKGGSHEIFNLVTNCFKELAAEYKMRLEAKPHHELKQDYQDFAAQQRPLATRESKGNRDDGDFHKRFNRMFEENKLEDDDHDIGYGHMMDASSSKRDDIEIPRTMQKFNNEKFNSVFEKKVVSSKEVIIYKEPEPLQLAKTIQYTELGGKTDDYSSSVERGERGLQYTDYMKAHTTSRLVNPNEVKERKEYKSVEDYESARNATFNKQQTDEEKRWLREREELQEKREYDRIQRMKTRDEAISKHYERVNGLLTR